MQFPLFLGLGGGFASRGASERPEMVIFGNEREKFRLFFTGSAAQPEGSLSPHTPHGNLWLFQREKFGILGGVFFRFFTHIPTSEQRFVDQKMGKIGGNREKRREIRRSKEK